MPRQRQMLYSVPTHRIFSFTMAVSTAALWVLTASATMRRVGVQQLNTDFIDVNVRVKRIHSDEYRDKFCVYINAKHVGSLLFDYAGLFKYEECSDNNECAISFNRELAHLLDSPALRPMQIP